MKYRNKKLLALANDCPVCCGCGAHNFGDVVAAHSNKLRDGKGKGTKAHDFMSAYLCGKCHYALDQGNEMNKEEKQQFFMEAWRNTVTWLFLSGHLEVK